MSAHGGKADIPPQGRDSRHQGCSGNVLDFRSVPIARRALACFNLQWPNLNFAVACFEIQNIPETRVFLWQNTL
jgi:hypothetical protein